MPHIGRFYAWRSVLYAFTESFREALEDLYQGIRLEPGNHVAYCDAAFILATCQQRELRDARKALDLATKACQLSNNRYPAALMARAAAQAELGDFKEAISWAQQAVVCPSTVEDARTKINAAITAYRAGQVVSAKDLLLSDIAHRSPLTHTD